MTANARQKNAAENRHRVDRWLWFARFFRSRSLAAQAVAGGKVHVNGEHAKPARDLGIGDRLDITLGQDLWSVLVRKLPSRRGSAALARVCYEEMPESELRRSKARDRKRTERSLIVAPPGRPDKRERRAIRRLHGRTDA